MATPDPVELENELNALTRLVESEGWKLYHAKWSVLHAQCGAQLRAQENPNRDWIAGLVTGYERLLGYPSKRMIEINKLLTNADKPYHGTVNP